MPTDIIGGKPRLFVSTVFEREEWDVERFELRGRPVRQENHLGKYCIRPHVRIIAYHFGTLILTL